MTSLFEKESKVNAFSKKNFIQNLKFYNKIGESLMAQTFFVEKIFLSKVQRILGIFLGLK